MTCPRCGSDPVDPYKVVSDHADDMAKQIDKEVLAGILKVGAWMDEDKDYQIGTREAYEAFVKKRNYTFGEKK